MSNAIAISAGTLKPFRDKVLVNPVEREGMCGSIIIPEDAREKSVEGEVVAVGDGKRSKKTGEVFPLSVQVGDSILYGKYGGVDVEMNGEKLVLMREDDILGIL